jgi:hypothetical protein
VLPQFNPQTGFVPKSQLQVLFQDKFYLLQLLDQMQDNGANL